MRRSVLWVLCAIALSAAGCATAVYDSLERRGVSAKDLVMQRMAATAQAAEKTGEALKRLETAFGAIDGAGDALPARVTPADIARGSAEAPLRLFRQQISEMEAAAPRWFEEWKADLQYAPDTAGEAAARDAAKTRYDRLLLDLMTAAATADNVLDRAEAQLDFVQANMNPSAAAFRKSERSAVGAVLKAAAKGLSDSAANARAFAAM